MVDISKRLKRIDAFQQAHPALAFPLAVIKKYGEDQGGYQAALLTYYGFLSLFPLLLVLTTLLQWLPSSDSHLRARIISGATNYFPIIGNELQRSVHGFRSTGLPLLIGILVLLYGARGVADAFRNTVNHIWGVPHKERSGFWPSRGKSYAIVFYGGIGFLTAALAASYAGATGHNYGLRFFFLAANLFFIFGAFQLVMRIGLDRHIVFREIWVGAAVATIGLFLLQNVGGYVVTHELKHLDSLYGTFALVLGLVFWLYLQAQLVVYALEIDVVRVKKRWPRQLF